MKQIETVGGDDVHAVFALAWGTFDHKNILTFHHNGCQIFICPDNAFYMTDEYQDTASARSLQNIANIHLFKRSIA